MRKWPWIVIGLLAVGTGCASRRAEPERQTTRPAPDMAATRPTDPALLSLDQIEPKPVLPQPLPATNPSARPPLEAVQLFAQARAAQIEGNRPKAITLLEKATALDGDSFQLHYTLGQVCLAAGDGFDSGVRALERAAQVRPDSLDVHLLLGRQYLGKGDADLGVPLAARERGADQPVPGQIAAAERV